jgi:threonine dehydratase
MIIPKPNTHRPTLKDFREAAYRIKGVAIRTPLVPLRRYREKDQKILLKPEMIQPVGSYKIRGVYNWVAQLPEKERKKGVSTVSAGNMSQALGYVANIFGVPSRAIIPDYAPETKIEASRRYGMDILVMTLPEIYEYIENPSDDYCFLNGLEEFGLLDGHGTIGLEIMEDAPDTDTIFVPVGIGFLSAGVALAAKALKPSVRVIGVNAELSPGFYESLRENKVVPVEPANTLADAINDPVSEDMLKLVEETLDGVVLASEDKIRDAIRFLAVENKLVAEGAGAISLAAALSTPFEERGNTVCVLSGGSIDPEKLSRILRSEK